MNAYQPSQDDIMDVIEMTEKIEEYAAEITKEHPNHLALSALISASVNCVVDKCTCFDEFLFYKSLFGHTLDASISVMQAKENEKPPSSS